MKRDIEIVEMQPEYVHGSAALNVYILENTVYPKEAFFEGIEGRVFVGFTIDIDGSITDVHIANTDLFIEKPSLNVFKKFVKRVKVDKCESIELESLRVVKNMQKWKPAMQNNEYVKVGFTLEIIFGKP
jgi:Gram-negative bacterial TonB protein C-terminal